MTIYIIIKEVFDISDDFNMVYAVIAYTNEQKAELKMKELQKKNPQNHYDIVESILEE